VDAAVELASRGHKVHIFTAHHDKNRCFEETIAGESISVCVYIHVSHFIFLIEKLHCH
jgi:alpha-1,3/alpha-1,6-mannosyltransferase